MKELDPFVLLAVFQEMLGFWLWAALAVAIVGAAAFIVLLWREKGVVCRRLVRAQAAGIIGGVAALAVMVRVSSSGFADAGGPVDWLLIILVFLAGLAATTILLYTLAGWRLRCRHGRLTPRPAGDG